MSKHPSSAQPSLLLENELLTNEVRHLRGRLSEAEARIEKMRAQTQRLRQQLAEQSTGQRGPGRESVKLTAKEKRIQELEVQALGDIHWLVNRIDQLPLVGRLLRNRNGFKTLLERYGADPRA